MPRYTRNFRQSRPRRTNWFGYSESLTVTGNSQSDVEILDPSDATTEIAKYVNPTIVRCRGFIMWDPDLSSALAAGGQIGGFSWALYVGEGTLDSLEITSPQASGGWNSDQILDMGYIHYSAHSTQATAVGANFYFLNHTVAEIDSKAMRKLEDRTKLRLAMRSEDMDGFARYVVRVLVKE